jgi:3'-phosphoadenosine 5'-phosphosulfate sulfotransferase (PAPS reductase)/FAD synthetase
MSDPFLITGPALISFSGGRTSAYMLWRILQAHGGELPDDVIVAFANTGKEREETLRFVRQCEVNWKVNVAWLEAEPGGFRTTDYGDASRAGEPFAALIARKKYTPNAIARFCTQELKVKPMHAFAAEIFGGRPYTEAIGLRADEPWRVAKMIGRNSEDGRQCVAPLAKAGVRKADVLAFWASQDFDLALPRAGAGNCDLCFLKSRRTLERLIAQDPSRADWWIAQEALTGGRFVTEYSYADLKRSAAAQPDFFDADEYDAECGLLCVPEPQP